MAALGASFSSMLLNRQAGGGSGADNATASGEAPDFSVTIDCSSGNGYDGDLGLRISSIFVILIGSLLGAIVPILLARSTKTSLPRLAFFIAKFFGSGVIIGTAFMHLLAPAVEALTNPCLQNDTIASYSWAPGIALMTVMLMFTIELVVAHFDIFGDSHKDEHEDGGSNPSLDNLNKSSEAGAPPANAQVNELRRAENGSGGVQNAQSVLHQAPNHHDELSVTIGGEDHLAHQRTHTENDSYQAFAAQMTALFILEFGVIFHSIFIGLTLAVAGSEFNILYIVLVFHQTFEGLGLGARLATAKWPRGKGWLPFVLGGAYGITTPIAIAAGLGVRYTLQPGSSSTLLVNGIFDSISAGILIYTGLVELLAHEFMFNPQMRKAGLKTQLLALLCVAVGCGLMALLAKWA